MVLGLEGIWGLFRVSLGISLGSNGQLEAGGGGVGLGGDLGSLWGLLGFALG